MAIIKWCYRFQNRNFSEEIFFLLNGNRIFSFWVNNLFKKFHLRTFQNCLWCLFVATIPGQAELKQSRYWQGPGFESRTRCNPYHRHKFTLGEKTHALRLVKRCDKQPKRMRKFQLSQCRVLISNKSENCYSFNRCGARPTCFQSKFWYLKGCLTDDSMKRQFRVHLENVELQKTCFFTSFHFFLSLC